MTDRRREEPGGIGTPTRSQRRRFVEQEVGHALLPEVHREGVPVLESEREGEALGFLSGRHRGCPWPTGAPFGVTLQVEIPNTA